MAIFIKGGIDLDRASEAQERELLELVSHIRNEAYDDEKAFDTESCSFGQIELARDEMYGSTIYEEGIIEPIRQLLLAADYCNVSLEGEIEISSDEEFYDDTTLIIKENKLTVVNTVIHNAPAASLIRELESRGFTVSAA